MKRPFFSIIIVSFNAEETIKKTIDSALLQTFSDYEIIVKDADSNDNTVSMIPQNEKIKTHINKDNGIYFGMNEAVSLAIGKFLIFMNCGDVFSDNTVLEKVYEAIKDKEDNIIVYGNYCRNGVTFKQPSKITPFYLYRTPLCHQTMFFGSEVLFEFESYNTNYKILADYDLTLKAFKNNVPFVYTDVCVCSYLGGGASESAKGIKIKREERKEIINKYFSENEIKKFNIKLFFSLKKLRQKLISDSAPKWVRKTYRVLVNLVNK